MSSRKDTGKIPVTNIIPFPERLPDLEKATLAQLCQLVTGYKAPFEDTAEFIEDRAYELCEKKQLDKAIKHLEELASFFERMPDKNEENCRDLSDVYILAGEIHQCHDQFAQSIEWFRKAVVVNDRYSLPFHSLAVSYIKLGDTVNAVRSLEQEIQLAPGNYFSYLMLADLYEARGLVPKVAGVLNRLLERDPDNVIALHRIITEYEHDNPELDVELLRRRLICVDRVLNKRELVIWTFHMCREGKFNEALALLSSREAESPDVSLIHLLKAHIYGETRQFTKKRMELSRFKVKNNGNEVFMQGKLKEFGDVFGEPAVVKLHKRLTISHHPVA